MTAVEYLSQAHRLNLIIASDLEELENLRQMSYSISSPSWEEKTGGTIPTDPPFVKCIFKIMELEEKIKGEVGRLISLKEEILSVIDSLEDTEERAVLRYRYLHSYKWEKIADVMCMAERTARRRHNSAIAHIVIPADHTEI